MIKQCPVCDGTAHSLTNRVANSVCGYCTEGYYEVPDPRPQIEIGPGTVHVSMNGHGPKLGELYDALTLAQFLKE